MILATFRWRSASTRELRTGKGTKWWTSLPSVQQSHRAESGRPRYLTRFPLWMGIELPLPVSRIWKSNGLEESNLLRHLKTPTYRHLRMWKILKGQRHGAYMIAMVTICNSLGRTSFASARFPGKIGPYSAPIKAAANAFSMKEWTVHIVICKHIAKTEERISNIRATLWSRWRTANYGRMVG